MKYYGIECPVCSQVFTEEDDIVVCPKCGAPYHRDCYLQEKKCKFISLHKEGKSWQPPVGESSSAESPAQAKRICPLCQAENPKEAPVCQHCGRFMPAEPAFPVQPQEKTDPEDEEDLSGDSERKTGDPFDERFISLPSANPDVNPGGFFHSAQLESQQYDEGVNGLELASFVGRNNAYYIPVFYRLKHFGVSRINFSVFLFGGAWYLFRKQYLKGILLSGLSLLLQIASIVFTYFFSEQFWEAAETELLHGRSAGTYIPYEEYLRWTIEHCSLQEAFLMYFPILLGLLNCVLLIVCALKANAGYYRFCCRKVSRIKSALPEDLSKNERYLAIFTAGGINLGAAVCYCLCALILYGAFYNM